MKKTVHNMKVKKANKVNNELNFNVDKHFKEPFNEKTVHVTCNKKFATKMGWKNVSKKTYPRRALVKLLWPNVKIKNGSRQSYMNASSRQQE